MKKRIAITGSKGIIGTVLKGGLSNDFEITSIDLPDIDARDYNQLLNAVKNSSAIIHLAWRPKIENWRSQEIDSDNITMYKNVYNASMEAKVPRVIMASSIHADDFYGWKSAGFMSPYRRPEPSSLYGADKVFMEELGRNFAAKGLEVVCVRFGGINPADRPPKEDKPRDMATWLSHNDCIALINSILKAKKIPNNFAVVYGVSDNKGRISDVSNPFGWFPNDSSEG